MKKIEQRSTSEAKCGGLDAACARYGIGRSSMRELASDAGAVIHVGRRYLVNYSLVDAYLDEISDAV